MNESSTKEIIVRATNELAKTAVNGVLWWIFLTGASIGKSKTSRGVYEMFREADEVLGGCNYDHFQQLLHQLRKKGLIAQRRKRTTIELAITAFGKERLKEVLPVYKKNRPWDGFVYLISYDIPEKSKRVRDQLREHLQHIGCAKLQASVWITPYAPQDLINAFAQTHQIDGMILVSKLDKHGLIGDETLSEIIIRLYRLQEIHERYKEWLTVKRGSIFQRAVTFQLILRDDPQLPFALLPSWWKGDEAHRVYSSIIVK